MFFFKLLHTHTQGQRKVQDIQDHARELEKQLKKKRDSKVQCVTFQYGFVVKNKKSDDHRIGLLFCTVFDLMIIWACSVVHLLPVVSIQRQRSYH